MVTDQQLFNAFKQDRVQFDGFWAKFGSGGNCASIALIKTAIGTYGINGVFGQVNIDSASENVHVILRNKLAIDLSFDRLEHASDHFFIDDLKTDTISKQIIAYAKFCFAVMCRVEQLKLGFDKKYFYRAVDRLNKGQLASEILNLLGLTATPISDVSINNLQNYKNLLVYNAVHAVYSSGGYYAEFFRGTLTGIEPLKQLSYFHSYAIEGAYLLK